MKSGKLLIALVVAILGGSVLFKNFNLDALKKIGLDAGGQSERAPRRTERSGRDLEARTEEVVRIASFNIQVFGESKLADQEITEILADIVRQFDIVAVQEIRAKSQHVLPEFLEYINADGLRYDYVLGERLGRTSSKEQYAFIYDTETIEIDPESTYTIGDPDDMLHREPLVAAFRSRLVAPEEAFTFTLINTHTDPDEVRQELGALVNVVRAVRNDGREEDDVILLGDLNAGGPELDDLAYATHMEPVNWDEPTNTARTHVFDNILVDTVPTAEYTGTYGVVDVVREYNLTTEDAQRVSDHLPTWAEFSAREVLDRGPVANSPGSSGRRRE